MLDILRQARVSTHIVTKENGVCLKIVVNEKYEHTFDAKQRESKIIFTTDKGTLQALFDKGTYVFYKGKLVEYRRIDSKTFIHSDEAIAELSDRIGIEYFEDKPYSTPVNGLFNQSRSKSQSKVFLGGEYSKFDFDVPDLFEGGQFSNALVLKWSPFSNLVTTSLEVERLVCTNGMVATAPFVTEEIPVINDWEESLRIIATRLESKIPEILSQRFKQMADPNSRSSVYDLQSAFHLLNQRLNNVEIKASEHQRLSNLIDLVDPKLNLGNIYNPNVLDDKKLSRIADGHLTQFDLFNILTEASTHYGRDEENDLSIQNHLNRVVFDEFKNKAKLTAKAPELGDSDHRRAFFGAK